MLNARKRDIMHILTVDTAVFFYDEYQRVVTSLVIMTT